MQEGGLPCLTNGTLRELHLTTILEAPLAAIFKAQVQGLLNMLERLPNSPAMALRIVFSIPTVSGPLNFAVNPPSKLPSSVVDDIARFNALVTQRFCPGTVQSIDIRLPLVAS